ncbi:C-terminal processing peptidase [Deinococcus peraridilitoris DSM 19664]|uniref:C-terminal processing peptidase n=2 Tax=Deinococcus TaxID=1298 RepID=K9ZWD1_DEIPD|nr:C-terminal processing peptidase [Deinococcus peraridilitoris DSM 19664]
MLIVAGALAATTAVGYAQLRTYTPAEVLGTPTGQTLLQALTVVDQIALKPVEREKLLEGAIKGMLATFEDPYTRYVAPVEAARDAEDQQGEFFGIGVTFVAADANGNGGRIEGVYKGGAAEKAGVRPGDVFLKIDGQDVSKIPQNEIVGKVRGKEGVPVKITFGRGEGSYEVTMTRARVTIVSVQSTVLPGNVGYVALNDFSNLKVLQQFPQVFADFKAKGIDKVVFDLRDNPGGNLCVSTAVVDQFLSSGDIMKVRMRGGEAGSVECPGAGKASNQATDYKGKLVVLTNGGSASASEITAGALQDAGRAQIVGEKTFGKGVVQVVQPLVNGGRAHITFEEWLTPKGRSINKEGIKPNVQVADTRYPKIVTYSGTGVQPGQKVTVTIGERKLETTADAEGKFTFAESPKPRVVPAGDGQAIVDLKTDAQLAKALEVINAK